MNRWAPILGLVMAALGACTDTPAPDDTPTPGMARHLASPDGRVFGTVPGEPSLALGTQGASGPAQFTNIRSVYVDVDGNIWVADGGSSEIRIFDQSGQHMRTVGGRGEGPGEYGRPRLLGSFTGDSVAAWDDRNPRLTVYDTNGDFAYTIPSPSGDGLPPQIFGVFRDGRLVGQVPHLFDVSELSENEVLTGGLTLRAFERTGESTELATVTTMKWIWTGDDQIPLPFSIAPAYTLVGDQMHLTNGIDYLVSTYRGGELVAEYGIDEAPHPVTSRDRQTYADFYATALTDRELRAAYLSGLDHEQTPDELPAFDRLLSDDLGRVWAERYAIDQTVAREWEVFGADHGWLGRVSLPPAFELRAIRSGRLFGIWRDDLDVEHVRAYEFHQDNSG